MHIRMDIHDHRLMQTFKKELIEEVICVTRCKVVLYAVSVQAFRFSMFL